MAKIISLTQVENDKYVKLGCKIGEGARIWGFLDTRVPKPGKPVDIRIGDFTVVGGDTRICCHCPITGMDDGWIGVHIGHDVWIGFGCIILPGVKIGDRTIIGAGSVVTKSIPSDCIAAGSPCKVLKSRSKYEIVRTNLLTRSGLSVTNQEPNWGLLTKDIIKSIFNITDEQYNINPNFWKR